MADPSLEYAQVLAGGDLPLDKNTPALTEQDLLASFFRRNAPSPLKTFPSHEDAAFASRSGFGYGERTDPYVQNKLARVFGTSIPQSFTLAQIGDVATGRLKGKFQPSSASGMELGAAAGATENPMLSANLDLTNPENKEIKNKMKDVYARAALAANRIPIAALGFDPSRMTTDTEIKDSNFAGAYLPSRDSVYFTLSNRGDVPSTPVHEAIHRGIEMLSKKGMGKTISNLPDEELVVRYLMATQAGDPEVLHGTAGQREKALEIFGDKEKQGQYQMALGQLTKAAQDEIARRKPRGPR